MAEARQPSHLLDVCNQKFSEFLFNAEHKCLVWLREIEEEAMKIFDSNNFSTEPELMPKTPSQRKYRKKKRSSLFKDENKELIRKRLSKSHGTVKTESFQKLSPRRVLNNLNMGDAKSLPDIMTNSSKGSSKVQSDKIARDPVGESLVTGCCKNGDVEEKRNEVMNGIPELFIVHSDDHLADISRITEISDSPAMVVPDITDPIKAEKNGIKSRLPSTPTLKESLIGKHTSGKEIPPQELVNNNLDPEGEHSQGLKESSATSTGSLSGHRRLSRPHKSPRISLVEKYSLSNKRKSTIRKSISRTIARKQAAQDSSSASSRVSCHSSTEIFLNDENHKHGPLTQNAEIGEPLNSLQKEPCALDAPSLVVSTPLHTPTQFERHQDKTCSKDRLKTTITDSHISNSEDLARNNSPHEQVQNIRKQSYRQAMENLPAPSCTEDKNPSPFSHTTTSISAKKMLPMSGPYKNQLLKSPGSSGNKVPKHSTPCRSATKEKERQRLESLRKKQEAEQQRKQKVEEEKKRRLEEIKLKREERLRKALQARERVEQMEEEKKKRMEQKFSQLGERNDKMREEKTAEEKAKKKISIKKIEAEVRKSKLPQMEERPKPQECPEKWRTVGEIKKMLEINSTRQEKGHQRHQEKEKLAKVQELAVVKEEEENVKEEKNPASLAQLQQDKTAVQVENVPAACGWLNITAQKSYSGTSNRVDAQDLKDTKSLKVNLNDYGMDLNSDDSTDDESQPRKPIPLWANGVQLNEAVTYQYYNPPEINRLFGHILSPKLEDIFYKSKPRYFKRTSSAAWQSPPLPGSKPALRMANSMKKY
ncbi:inner centromere protein-like isoform X2 [Ahaetulla prasina]|uniref:inner centromere protein-like isoform X2 n=1 Tax=Ahaetulla prasina TaxID=499056 RepID=UPI002647A1FB|nr:inner centromere protein-like isoform X2 [Ahaetulla prasina]